MKIAIVADRFPKLTETFVVSKFLGLLDRGWDAHVVATRTEPGQWNMVPELTARPRIRERVHIATDVAETITELEPRIVYFSFGVLAEDLPYLRQALGARIVVSFRGFDLNDLEPDDQDFYSGVWEEADLVHLVSHDIWERARRLGCPATKRHVIIPDAIDVDVFDPGDRRHDGVAGTAERPLRVLSVGRMTWKKGYEHALQALKLLADDGCRCEYRIIGEGDYRPAVLFTMHDTALAPAVHLLGAQPRSIVRESMRWADVFLHAAVTEGFCVSVIEAQAMALPVVCSDAGGLPENVAAGETGFVVPRRDPRALADALAVLARDPALRQRMGQAGRRRAETHFSLEDQLDRFDRHYRDLLDQGAEVAPGASPRSRARSNRVGSLRRRMARLEVDADHLRQQLTRWGHRS